jgi:hypothetical protein
VDVACLIQKPAGGDFYFFAQLVAWQGDLRHAGGLLDRL